MQVIDEEGRIFGKFNLVDVVIGGVLLGVIPIIYGAFVLFRTPDPVIQSIEPNRVTVDSVGMLRLTGMYLSPSLRVVIGDRRAESFLVESQTSAEVRLPDLSAGTYDVVLLDEELELTRLVSALVVEPAPAMTISSIEPSYVLAGEPGSLRIHGERFQPYLLARFVPEFVPDNKKASAAITVSFLVESQTSAEVRLPDLSAGTYDVVLLAEGDAGAELELTRLVSALVVEPAPAMTISSVEPAYVLESEPGSLRIHGKRFQPYLTARFVPGNNGAALTAQAFLVESSTEAEIKLPLLPAGGYELVLYDAQNVVQARAPDLFTVIPVPTITSPERCQGNPCLGGARVVQGEAEYLNITGEYFDPYMQAHFEPYLSVPNSVVHESPEPIVMYPPKTGALTSSEARIKLPELDPFTYTLVLSRPLGARSPEYAGSGPIDGPRELVRIQGVLTVLAQPEPDPVNGNVRVAVRFVSQPGVQLIMNVGDQDTSIFGIGDRTDYLPNFPVDEFNTDRIAEFLGQAPEEMHQRVLKVLEDFGVLSGLVAGRGGAAQQVAQASWEAALAGDEKEQLRIIRILNFEDQTARELPVAEVQSVRPRRTMSGSATVGLPFASPGGPSYITDQTVEVVEAVIDIPVTLTPRGWAYGEQYIKVGSLFQMETLDYAVQGWVIDMELLSRSDTEHKVF